MQQDDAGVWETIVSNKFFLADVKLSDEDGDTSINKITYIAHVAASEIELTSVTKRWASPWNYSKIISATCTDSADCNFAVGCSYFLATVLEEMLNVFSQKSIDKYLGLQSAVLTPCSQILSGNRLLK